MTQLVPPADTVADLLVSMCREPWPTTEPDRGGHGSRFRGEFLGLQLFCWTGRVNGILAKAGYAACGSC